MNREAQNLLSRVLRRTHMERKFRSYLNKLYPAVGKVSYNSYIQFSESELAVQRLVPQVKESDLEDFKTLSKIWITELLESNLSTKLTVLFRVHGTKALLALTHAIDEGTFNVPAAINMSKDKSSSLKILDDLVENYTSFSSDGITWDEIPVSNIEVEDLPEPEIEVIPADNARAWVDILKDAIQEKSTAFTELINVAKAEMEEAVSELEKYVNQDTQSDAWEARLELANARYEAMSRENDNLQETIASLNKKVSDLTDELETKRAGGSALMQEHNQAIKTIADLRSKVADLKQELEQCKTAPKTVVKLKTKDLLDIPGVGKGLVRLLSVMLPEHGIIVESLFSTILQ